MTAPVHSDVIAQLEVERLLRRRSAWVRTLVVVVFDGDESKRLPGCGVEERVRFSGGDPYWSPPRNAPPPAESVKTEPMGPGGDLT